MRDKYADVRASACLGLGRGGFRGESVSTALKTAAHDGDREVERSALLALGMRGATVSPFLLEVLVNRSEPAHRRASAAVALGLSGNAGVHRELERFADPGVEPEVEVRTGCVMGMGFLRDERCSVGLLRILFGRDDERVRASALTALANSGWEKVTIGRGRRGRSADLLRVFDSLLLRRSEPDVVRRSAALALGARGDSRSLSALMKTARTEKNGGLRAFAYLALGERNAAGIGNGSPAEFLARCLAMERGRIARPYLVLAMGLSGDRRLAHEVRKLFLEESPNVRSAAALSLGLLGAAGTVSLLEREFLEARSVPDLRARCGEALGLIGGSRAARALREGLSTLSAPVLRASAMKGLAFLGDRSAVPLLVGGLGEKNRGLRKLAVLALGFTRNPASVLPLIEAIEREREPETRALAVVSLGRIAEGCSALPVLRRISDHRDWAGVTRFPTLSLFLRLL